MKTQVLDPSSKLSTDKGGKTQCVPGKDEIRRRWREAKSRFPGMTEAERVDEFRKFWEMEFEATELDTETGCLYSSIPLMRVFTICQDELVQGYLRLKGEKLSTHEEIMAAVQDVKNSIESTICCLEGVMKEGDGAEFGYHTSGKPRSCFYGFQEGFGSDDHLIGMFFSEVGRTEAIRKVVDEWGQYGVRTEPYSDEGDVHDKRNELWELNFNRKEFRKQFTKLSHDGRLKAIDDLSAKGIKLQYTDPRTCIVYMTRLVPFGDEKNYRRFSYEFGLDYPQESLPHASERRGEVDRVERSLLGIIAKHDGFVTRIKRDISALSQPCMRLQDSEEFDGDGTVYVQFPDEATRRRASEEVFETLTSYGVRFQSEKGEVLSNGEQIAKAHRERDRLESDWRSLKCRKECHREEAISLEKDEAELLQRELKLKEIERNIADPVK